MMIAHSSAIVRHRPFASACATRHPASINTRAVCRSRVCSVRQPSSSVDAESITENITKLALGLVALVPAPLLLAGPAFSEEETYQDAVDAFTAAAVQEQSASNLFVSVMFVTVVGLLAVVTLGVAYLSLKTWLDNRQEQEDRNQKEAAIKMPATATKSEAKPSEEDVLVVRRSSGAKRDKSKGFGGFEKEF